jgi:antitoxin (DNA-binding transcriptional repressor) of toxin-antitoxin stability system
MQTVNIRDLLHNFSHYLNDVKEGDSITILERKNPVAEIIPHNKNLRFPAWKRPTKRRKIKGEAFSKTTEKLRKFE